MDELTKHKYAKEVLLEAAAILEPPGAWIQGEYAKDENGNTVASEFEGAVCFCIVGAIRRAASKHFISHLERDSVENRAVHVICQVTDHLPTWNDHKGRKQEEVVALLRTTAEQM